jgi:hypothetical protein
VYTWWAHHHFQDIPQILIGEREVLESDLLW